MAVHPRGPKPIDVGARPSGGAQPVKITVQRYQRENALLGIFASTQIQRPQRLVQRFDDAVAFRAGNDQGWPLCGPS